jgi:hypothetical protein
MIEFRWGQFNRAIQVLERGVIVAVRRAIVAIECRASASPS